MAWRSGGGWQDSGGIWPGIKSIEGVAASVKDPEFNISRGCLLPEHKLFGKDSEVHPEFEERITSSLVLMHGGMASNVGPFLEMVTEKYLLRSSEEWKARRYSNEIYDEIVQAIKTGDIKRIALLTTDNFNYPVKTIIPAATNHFTETIIEKSKKHFGNNYWGFLMLGGISGGGMGMFFDPSVGNTKDVLLNILEETKLEMDKALPFAMNPVVYNFGINNNGSNADLLTGRKALLPGQYYSLIIPLLVNKRKNEIPDIRKMEFDLFTESSRSGYESYNMLRSIVGSLFKFSNNAESYKKKDNDIEAEKIKTDNGFDVSQHEQIRQDLIKGRIGLYRNRLPAETIIEDVSDDEIVMYEKLKDEDCLGRECIIKGGVAVMCLAAGVGTRWTKGAGVIKAINPFININGKHRSFIEIHLAKNKEYIKKFGTSIPVIVSTSYLTHNAIYNDLKFNNKYSYEGEIYLSPGKSIGQRLIPMERDLRYLWEIMPQEQLDENKQKVRDAYRQALIAWAKSKGEGSDYSDNIALQRLNPVGHWYEFSNMLRNGTLGKLFSDYPLVENIMLHNIDTLGVTVTPEIVNYHIKSGNTLTFEVIPRFIEDRGGGLAKINGRIKILEGLAQPHDEDELSIRYYNTMTTLINIDKLLALFSLTRQDIIEFRTEKINNAVRKLARKLPTYITIKDVKYRWGNGQEDIYPVAQYEKLWSDMSGLPDNQCGFVVVPRKRGHQLKDPAQIDAWINDGSKEYISSVCSF
jgi:UDP-N-acetylglucosamine pyrophosphorylase